MQREYDNFGGRWPVSLGDLAGARRNYAEALTIYREMEIRMEGARATWSGDVSFRARRHARSES